MVAATVQLGAEGTGPKIQAFSNTINAVADTRTQAAVLVDQFGVPIGTAANPVAVIDPDTSVSGTITATDAVVGAPAGAGAFVTGASTAGSLVALAVTGGESAAVVGITGLTTGSLYFEGSMDSTNGTDGNWIAINGSRAGIIATVIDIKATANGVYGCNCAGFSYIRVRSSGALSGTPTVRIRLSSGPSEIFLGAPVVPTPLTLGATVTGTTGVAATLSLPAVAGQYHYISLIQIELYATAARTGGATPILVTSTNLPGSPVWDFETGQAIGTTIRRDMSFPQPLRSLAVNTATTIVAPIATTGIWRINAFYYTAP